MRVLQEDDSKIIKPYTNGRLNCLGTKFWRLGVDTLKRRKVCLIVLAGGQGSRLGFDGPKGLYELEGVGSLFSILQKRIRTLSNEYGTEMKTFVMTSEFTHEKTKRFFQGTGVELFKQESEFCLDKNNNFIPFHGSYAKAPNGNGGIYKAIRNIDLSPYEIVNVVSVDNVLAKVFDPVAVGCLVSGRFDVLSKSVTRRKGENTGVFVLTDRIEVREYSETKCVVEGAQANILNHIFSTKFLSEMKDKQLEYHYAHKKIRYTDGDKEVMPSKPNGYKKELFIFDSFKYTTNSAVMCVPRELEFSPLKNGVDAEADSPRTCARDYARALILEKALPPTLLDDFGAVSKHDERPVLDNLHEKR